MSTNSNLFIQLVFSSFTVSFNARKMFLEKIDWKNPRFSKWNLQRLGQLNEAQRDAFFADDVSKIQVCPTLMLCMLIS